MPLFYIKKTQNVDFFFNTKRKPAPSSSRNHARVSLKPLIKILYYFFFPETPLGLPTRIIAQRKPRSSAQRSCCKNLLVPGTIQ